MDPESLIFTVCTERRMKVKASVVRRRASEGTLDARKHDFDFVKAGNLRRVGEATTGQANMAVAI
jgi:hypothetical protein